MKLYFSSSTFQGPLSPGEQGELETWEAALSRTSGVTAGGTGQPVLCVASLLKKGCLGLDSGCLEKEKR